MKTKTLYDIEFKVYGDTKIDGKTYLAVIRETK